MTKCRSRLKSVDHSHPETQPEMFTVTRRARGGRFVTRAECLQHAKVAEEQGYHVEIIPT